MAGDQRPLRIALLIGSLQGGGAERRILSLARGFLRRGHAVRLYLLHRKGIFLSRAVDDGIDIFDVGLPKLRPAWQPAGKGGALRALWRTRQDLRSFAPDIFYAWNFEAEAWAVACKRLGAPGRLVTCRVVLSSYLDRTPWKRRVQDLLDPAARLVIANSRTVRQDVLAHSRNLRPGRVIAIHNGVDEPALACSAPCDLRATFDFLADATAVAVHVANLRPPKGHLVLADAWARIHDRFPGAHLLCLGHDEGVGRPLRLKLASLGIAHRVHLLGSRRDVLSIVKGADLFILPSFEEGLSNALLEAMACGLPVVATGVAGTPEAVADGRTGILVPPGDAESLAGAIARLLADPSLRHRMGARGRRRRARLFTEDRSVDLHLRAFRRLMGGTP